MGNNSAKQVALGGMMAALAVVVMCLGGLIPIATYTCPMICGLLLLPVMALCPERVCWAWYGAVAILSVLLGPDKEAALIFLFLGYYPILHPKLERIPVKILRIAAKLLLCNAAALCVFAGLTYVLGLDILVKEYEEYGLAAELLFLAADNLLFFLIDGLLRRMRRVKWKGK